MSCRRAFELDLAEFVADPRASEFAAFLEHYPACAECSAEVRAWTELEAQLRGEGVSAHPDEATLLRFEQSPGSLGAAERRRVESHLATCHSCADELAALRAFDFSALAPGPAPALEASGSLLSGLLGRLRGLVLHPAFAYALALALLYPTARWVLLDLGSLPEPSAPRAERAFGEPERPPSPAVEPSRSSGAERAEDAARRAAEEGAGLGMLDSPSAPAPESPAPPASAPLAGRVDRDRRAKQSRAQAEPPANVDVTRGIAAAEALAGVRAPAESDEAVADRLAPRAEPEKREAQLELGESAGALHLEPTAPPEGAKAPVSQMYLYSLESAERSAALPGMLRFDTASGSIAVPLPADVSSEEVVEIRIASSDGAREIRERFAVEAGAGQVEMKPPAEWLTPGIYRVERRVIAADTSVVRSAEFLVRIR
jgi:hypothetical protein